VKVGLLSLRWCQYGGWPTYKRHMLHALEATKGIDVHSLSVDKPAGASKWVDVLESADQLDEYDVVHLDNAVCEKTPDPILETLRSLSREHRLVVTIHDPTEIRKKKTRRWLSLISRTALFVFIRDSVARADCSQFLQHRQVVLHPYKRESDGILSGKRVVATSRVDFDKNTKLILDADCGVEIHTGYVNHIYDYEELGGIRKMDCYKGSFKTPADVYPGACALVDMSTIHMDGGGTQYTFLEAMDYGLTLICNAGWATGSKDELKPGDHYIAVSTAKELRQAVRRARKDWEDTDNGPRYESILHAHSHRRIGKTYKSLFQSWQDGSASVQDASGNTGINRWL